MGKTGMDMSTSPASPEEILVLLQEASSQDASKINAQANVFQNLEDRTGSYDVMHQIAAQRDLPLVVRQMAIIQFKNIIQAKWRSRKYFTDEHRSNIRQRSMQFLDEQDDTIAKCSAIIVSKIARADFPATWPSLASDLAAVFQVQMDMFFSTGQVQPSNILVLNRVLQCMAVVVKEFAGMKMLTGPRAMQSFTDGLHLLLYRSYAAVWELCKERLNPEGMTDPRLFEALKMLQLLFKPLSRMMVWLWNKSEKTEYKSLLPVLQDFFRAFTIRWNDLTNTREAIFNAFKIESAQLHLQATVECLTRHLLSIGKSFRKWQRGAAGRFVHLPGCPQWILQYWAKVAQSAASGAGIQDSLLAPFPLRYIVLGMALFRDCLSQWSPQRRTNVDGTGLSAEFVLAATDMIISQFLPLSEAHLNNWFNDPEQWLMDETKESDAWEYELRPTSQRVLITLASQYPDQVTPILLRVLHTSQTTSLSYVQKEAVYFAIGSCEAQLRSKFDFDQWVRERLVVEIADEVPDSRILKRRIVWVIGKYVSDAEANPTTPAIWHILHSLLNRGPTTDIVVRLASAFALCECVDSVAFDLSTFTPHIGGFIIALLQLIQESEENETKRKILHTLDVVIERGGALVIPYTSSITEAMPQFWSTADEDQDYASKGALLSTATQLVKALRAESQALVPFLVPLVVESFSPVNKVQLDTDALELWHALLRNANALQPLAPNQPCLLDLLPKASEFMANDLDLLGTMSRIVESYCLLDGNLVLQFHGHQLLNSIVNALTHATTTNSKDVLNAVHILLRTSSFTAWGEALHMSGLFTLMTKTLIEDKVSTLILTEYIYIFSRICLADANLFIRLVQSTAAIEAQNGWTESSVLSDILDQWWNKFDNMSEPSRRKLTAMGIASLATTGHKVVLERLPTETFNLWLDCFFEIKEAALSESSSELAANRHWHDVEKELQLFVGESEGTVEKDRRLLLFRQDPVQTQRLSVFVQDKLREIEIQCGGSEVFQKEYLSKADEKVLEQLLGELRRDL